MQTYHSIRFNTDKADEHRKVFAAIRATGVECWEAGPGTTHDIDIRVAQRWEDAGQFVMYRQELSRLRFAILDAIKDDSTAGLAEALKRVEKLPDWEWR